MALIVSDDNIEEVLGQNEITVLDFWAPWCGPCKVLGPIVDDLANGNPTISIGKVNVEENTSSAQKYNVRAIPTVIFFKGGVEVERVMGVKTLPELQVKIDSLN